MTKTDILLIKYATGTTSRYNKAVVILLLFISKKARRKLSALEEVGGDIILSEEPSDLSSKLFEDTIKKIN